MGSIQLTFNSIPILLALIATGISVYIDVRWLVIKNHITFPLLIVGSISTIAIEGVDIFALKLVVGVVFLLIIGIGGYIGGGDKKLIIGIMLCLPFFMAFLYCLVFSIVSLLTNIYYRLKWHDFNVMKAFFAMKHEVDVGLSEIKQSFKGIVGNRLNIKDASDALKKSKEEFIDRDKLLSVAHEVHGREIKKPGAPSIFIALVLTLIMSKFILGI